MHSICKVFRSKKLFFISLTIILFIGLSSCSNRFAGCYDLGKYQKKQKRMYKDGIKNYHPVKFKHTQPIRKKWVIPSSKSTVLGHNK